MDATEARIHFLGNVEPRTAGSSIYNYNLVTSLAHRGLQLTVVGNAVADDVEKLVRTVHSLRQSPWRNSPILWRMSSYLDLLTYQRTLSKSDLEVPDLIIICELLLFSYYRKRFAGIPFIYLPHSLIAPLEVKDYCVAGFSRRFLTRLYSNKQMRCLNESALSVRFTEAGCRALSEFYGSRISPRFIINPIGIQIPKLDSRDKRDAKNPIRLLFVGRLVSSKNVSGLIKTLFTLDRIPDWTLDIIGEGEQCKELVKLVNSLGLNEKVRLRGFQCDVGRWYRDADIFVSMSTLESLNLTLLESMAHGVPVVTIASRQNGFFTVSDEIVADGKTGYVASDPDGFKARLSELMSDPDTRCRMGRAAREHVKANLSWEHHINRWIETIESVL